MAKESNVFSFTLMSKAFSTHNIQSPEVTSKALHSNEELNDSFETLREKLSATLLSSNAKDELVKQHAKVAEEAVSGFSAFLLFPCI